MCNEWTWHLGVWFCSGAGSVMFTVGPDDLNGLFKPKSFYVLMKIFLFLQSGKQTPRKNNCPYSYSNDHVSFFSLEKKADSSFNSIFPPISLLTVTWPCLHCLRSLLVPVCVWLAGLKAVTKEQKIQNEISSSTHIIKMFLNRPSS